MVVIALGLAVAVVTLFRQSTLAALIDTPLNFDKNMGIVALTIGLALLISVLASLYPALFSTSINPAFALKGTLGTTQKGKAFRIGLIGLQFTVSIVLIICAICGMAYVGGFFEGVSFSEAIGYNPTAGLSLGAFAGLVTAFVLYIPRGLMTPKEFIKCIVDGIGSIVPPMLILILSWSLGGVCRQLIGTGVFISGFVSTSNLPMALLPVLIFVIAALMSFSMGTSWGTFGMLIPIVTMICETDVAAALLLPALGATLAGSVYGDHCSPMHIRHVETQLPYATLVAVVCAVGYLIAGFTLTPWISIVVATLLLIGAVVFLSGRT